MDDDTTRSAQDDPMARLEAADPAASAVPDVEAVRAMVDERVWAGLGDDLEKARKRRGAAEPVPARGWSWLTVAAAACTVALAAGVAFTAGRSSTPNDSAGVTASAPIALGAAGAQDTRSAAGSGAPVMGMERAAPMYYGGASRTVFVAGDALASQGGKAEAFAYDATAVDGRAATASLATALGVAGTAELRDGMWTVGGRDGTTAQASVQFDGMRTFYAYDPAADPYACLKAEPVPAVPQDDSSGAAGTSPSGGSVPGSPGCASASPAAPPTAKEAIAAARAFMAELGVEPDGFQWTATEDQGAPLTSVNAVEVVDGQQTGAGWWLSMTSGARIVNASGFLAPRISLGSYEVVSPRVAVERLGDPRFGAFMGGPIAMAADARGPGVATSAAAAGVTTATAAPPAPMPTEPPAPAQPGAAVPWPVTTVTITSCRLGWAQTYAPTGAVSLVPTYECRAGDAVVASVIAVADAQLDFTP